MMEEGDPINGYLSALSSVKLEATAPVAHDSNASDLRATLSGNNTHVLTRIVLGAENIVNTCGNPQNKNSGLPAYQSPVPAMLSISRLLR